MKHRLFVAALLSTLAVSCNGSSGDGSGGGASSGGGGSSVGLTTKTLEGLALDADAIVDLDATVDERFRAVFARYSAIELPQGRIHLLAQGGVPDAKLCRVREVLRQHVTDLPGGAAKDDVVQAMVDRGAVLGLFQDAAAADAADPDVAAVVTDLASSFVPLPATHVVLEGSAAYMQASPAPDLTFGATGLLVHRTGLAVARPAFAAELEALAAGAVSAGEFVPSAATPAGEEAAAFLAMVMDVHADVYGHDPFGDGSARVADASYAFGSRDALRAGAPAVAAWIEGFFGTDHTFQVDLPADFTGTFDGLRRGSTPYSARSQHLRTIRLTGSNSAEIFAAPFSSRLEGNAANNNFKGRAGDDVILGGDGFDTAVFNGPLADYDITILADRVIVEDVRGGHEHLDTLFGIERLQFSDQGINL